MRSHPAACFVSVGSADPQISGKLASEYRAAVYNHSRADIRELLDGLVVIDPPGVTVS